MSLQRMIELGLLSIRQRLDERCPQWTKAELSLFFSEKCLGLNLIAIECGSQRTEERSILAELVCEV